MARRYAVKPRRQPGRRSYIATFYDATNRRVTRGLGTQSEHEAKIVAESLVFLRRVNAGSRTAAEVAQLPSRALDLYFGEQDAQPAAIAGPELVGTSPGLSSDVISALPPNEARSHLVRMSVELEYLRRRVSELESTLAQERAEHRALAVSALARAATAASQCPNNGAALEQFVEHLRASTSKQNVSAVSSVARRFIEWLPADVPTPAHVTPALISRWLDEQSCDARSPVARRSKLRNRLGRFLRWGASLHGFANPMEHVRAPGIQQLRRERGDIHWHTQAEVEKALEGMSTYWQAVIATLAYAGLQLAELCWLRVEDLQPMADGRKQLWITAVDDGHGAKHDLKTGHRQRAVSVHPTLLWPRLESHLVDHAGELFLFPQPSDVRRRRRAAGGHPERWLPSTLARRLVGDSGGKNKRARPGLLPAGVSPSSLRRTFGSLLLRSGKSVAEVAAAMGNTPAVVQEHYARIIGAEVDVDF